MRVTVQTKALMIGVAAFAAATFTVFAVVAEVPSTPRPVLWLRADRGIELDREAGLNERLRNKVADWKDQSGKGNDFSQSVLMFQPKLVKNAINGKPALRFTGREIMKKSGPLVGKGKPQTVFVVTKIRKDTDGGVFMCFTGDRQIRTLEFLKRGNIFSFFNNGRDAGRALIPTKQLKDPYAQPFVICYTLEAGRPISVFLNGKDMHVKQGRNGGNTTIVAFKAATGVEIGNRTDYPLTGLRGDIAEIVVYDSILSAGQRQSVEKKLMKKYSINSLPEAANQGK